MKNQNYFILIFMILLAMSCKNDDDGQTLGFQGNIDWVKTYGGSQEDFARSVIPTLDGNILVFGNSSSIDGDITDKNIEVSDYWLLKLNPEGSIIWSKTYGGSGEDVGQKVIQTSDGGFAIVGYSKSDDIDASNNEGQHDNWILKLDNSGNILWEKSFGYAGHDHSYSVIETNDGGFFMTGFLDITASEGEGSTVRNNRHGIGEFWCHKLDANGNIEWRNYFGGTNNDRSFDVVQANDGGFVVTGFSESNDFDVSNSHGSYDYWVIKINSVGEMVWEKSLGGTEIDQGRSIIKTNDNAYIIAGNSFSTDGDISMNFGSSDFLLVKLSDDGNIIWSKNYGGSQFDFATSINSSSDGYLVTGYSQSIDNDVKGNFGENDFWILKISEEGNLKWQRNFGGSRLDLAYDAFETIDGDIIVVGETESNDIEIDLNKGLKDILVIKIK
jgi:hypothetical protein